MTLLLTCCLVPALLSCGKVSGGDDMGDGGGISIDGAPPPPPHGDMSVGNSPDACMSACGAMCVDLINDPHNCGACGKMCGTGESCKGGMCQGMAPPPPMPKFCNDAPPAGAKVAPAPPHYPGTCPHLSPGKNTIMSSGHARTFLLDVPAGLMAGEKLPVIFLWYWLKGTSEKFNTKGEVQQAVDSQRFLGVLPDAKGDLFFNWPFNVADPQARLDEEFHFFDDMYACVAAQFNINNNCVASAGVSAGALFTDQLAAARGEYLSSALSLSGGVNGVVRPWGNPAHKLPFIVLWGGDHDWCVVDFHQASLALENSLSGQGNFYLECIHNCGHAEPPFTAPTGLSKYAALWQFVFDHPYWLAPGDSPYKRSGIPASYPSWCAIGKGKAVPRTGPCPDKGC